MMMPSACQHHLWHGDVQPHMAGCSESSRGQFCLPKLPYHNRNGADMEAKGSRVLVAVCPSLLEEASRAECDRSVSSASQRLAMDAFIHCSELFEKFEVKMLSEKG